MAATNATIAAEFITQFSDSMFLLAQQRAARFRGAVEVKELTGEFSMENRVGSVEAQDLNTRSPRVNAADMPWDVRQLVPQRFGVPMWVDKWDAERMLTDPQSIVAMRSAEAMERKFDRICIKQLLATVQTGRQANVPLTAAQDGVWTVDATGGFNYETLLQIDQNFQGNEVETDTEGQTAIQKWLFISEQEHASLMKEGTLISRDFVDQRVVENGKLRRVMDFNVVVFGSKMPIPMLNVAGGVRTCFAIASGALRVRMQRAWEVDVVELLQNVWDTAQIRTIGIMGATRMEGVRVQQVNTTAQ